MTSREDNALEESASARQRLEQRHAACRALGIDPATIPWAELRKEHANSEPALAEPDRPRLSEAEWRVLVPMLPAEAPQAKVMSNRAFIEAVLDAMQRNCWVSPISPAADIEAVRRRFGRWAHQGVFQALSDRLPELTLSPDTKNLLMIAGKRAARLKARTTR